MVDAILRKMCTSGRIRESNPHYSIFTQIVFATQCEEKDESYRLLTGLTHLYTD